jgi:ATP-dependent Lon protease
MTSDSKYNSEKVRQIFEELSIDKRRLPSSGLTEQGVPSFVAEWLLDKKVPGTGFLTPDEQTRITDFVNRVFPRKDDQQKIAFQISQGDVVRVISLMQVRIRLTASGQQIPEPYALIPRLGNDFDRCRISTEVVRRNEMLLRKGVWGIITLAWGSDGVEIQDFDPFQCSTVDYDLYAQSRSHFSTEEWRDLMICSMGFNPQHPSYTIDAKTWILSRLLPIVTSNYHLMELAPKGTGKSFFFENVSNRVKVISGGKITPARLFINGSTGEIGLLGVNDVVVLDEVQSLTFDQPDEIIGPLKTYLANGNYNRGGFADISSDCSLMMLANIELDDYMQPKYANNLIANLPRFFSETAFLDRFAGIIPGWRIPKFDSDMKPTGVGLKTDFFGEALLSMRQQPRFLNYVNEHISFPPNTTIRDQNSIKRSAAGFLKILYPHLELTFTDFDRDCLQPAQQLRQYIRNTLYSLDDEFRVGEKDLLCQVI